MGVDPSSSSPLQFSTSTRTELCEVSHELKAMAPPEVVQAASESASRRCSSGGSSRAEALAALAQMRGARKMSGQPVYQAPVSTYDARPSTYEGHDNQQIDMSASWGISSDWESPTGKACLLLHVDVTY